MKYSLFCLVALLATCGVSQAQTADAASYQSAVQQAQSAESRAGQLHCQWNVTNDTLKQAKAAADAKDYDKAKKLAEKAEALADLSIAQYQAQLKLWRNEVVR